MYRYNFKQYVYIDVHGFTVRHSSRRGVRNGDSPRDGTVWARIAVRPSCEASKPCGPNDTSHKHSSPGQLPRCCDVPKSHNLTTSERVGNFHQFPISNLTFSHINSH